MEKFKLFCTDQRGEDLLKWAENLEALGDIVDTLHFYREGEGYESFNRYGDRLGNMISDYAKAIHDVMSQCYWEVNEYFEGDDDVPLHHMKRRLERMQKKDKYYPPDIDSIDEALRKLQPTFDSVMDVSCGLHNLREEIIEGLNRARKERALAGTDSVAKAQDADQ